MPELPEVETTATSLQPLLTQKVTNVMVYCQQLRWQIPHDLNQLIDYQLTHIQRRAKYLILTFQQQNYKQLLIHLGMSGSLQQYPNQTPKRKHDHVIIQFANTQLHYHDPRRFGAMVWLNDYQDKLMKKLGVEPLTDEFTADYLYHTIHSQKKPIQKPIKTVIMEQNIVVGVGNIYATESLFLAKIHPLTPANQLHLNQLQTLVQFIKQILQHAILQGGSSLKDFSIHNGKTGYFQQTLQIYGQKTLPCPVCQTPIENIKINQRASTFCPK